MAIELFENRKERYFVIRDANSVLTLSEDEFNAMKKSGKSPLMQRLWEEAKRQRGQKGQ
jgi:hypothetical protein